MNKANLYHKANQVQHYAARDALTKFSSKLKWRSDGGDSILDAGCGNGDVTFNVLMPILPATVERVVAVDVSKKMIDYAQKTHIHPKLSFGIFNLNEPLDTQAFNGIESFDHVVSFSCLSWIPNQKVCMENFNKLLKPNGDLLLEFTVKHPLYDAYKRQSKDNRWAQYMSDVDQIITPYQYSSDTKSEFENLLSECGFKDYAVTVMDRAFFFDCTEKMRDTMHAVNPFYDSVPAKDRQTYIDDFLRQFVELGCAMDDFDTNPENCRFNVLYKIIIAYAKK